MLDLKPGDALLIIGVQNDFLPGRSLAVAGGNEIIPLLNRYIADFHSERLPIFATRDWHPAGHCSFKIEGGLWPAHCIAGTAGAAFPADLRLPFLRRHRFKGHGAREGRLFGFSGNGFGRTAWLRAGHAAFCRRTRDGLLRPAYGSGRSGTRLPGRFVDRRDSRGRSASG